MGTSSIGQTHQYIIKDITLISHDGKEYSLDSQFVEFSFEESIFQTTIHGTMTVLESVDYPAMLPMIGEERIRVSFTRTDEQTGDELDPIKFELPIYSLHGKMQEGKSGKRQTYSLSYCSDTVYKNLNSVVSKSFKDMTYSQMAETIYNDFLKDDKPIVTEQTEGLMNYIVQNQRPIKAIISLCKRSTSAEGNGLFYVFFEDRDQFNFVTMKKLMQQEPVRTIYYGMKNLPLSSAAGEVAGVVRNLAHDLYGASKVNEVAAGFDILRSAMSGEGSSAIMTVDPIRRGFQFKTLDLRGNEVKSAIEKAVGSPAPLEFAVNSDLASIAAAAAPATWTKKSKLFINPRGSMKLIVGDSGQNTQEYIAQRDPNVRPYNPEEFYIQREAEKRQFLKNIISLALPGDPRIKAGCVIKFNFPQKSGFIGENNPEELDRYMQGNYIVVGVAHIISRGKYKMNLELMKNTAHSEIQPVDMFKDFLT